MAYTTTTEGGGGTSVPPIDIYGPPAPVYGPPAPVVVDRQLYLQQQQQAQQQAEADRRRYFLALEEIRAERARNAAYQRGEGIPPMTPESTSFLRGIVETIDPYERAKVDIAANTPELKRATRENVVVPLQQGESYYRPGYVQGTPDALRHELTHAVWYQQLSSEQRAQFLSTVLKLARTNPAISSAIRESTAVNQGNFDPQHVYTRIVESGAVPPELQQFYSLPQQGRFSGSPDERTRFLAEQARQMQLAQGLAGLGALPGALEQAGYEPPPERRGLLENVTRGITQGAKKAYDLSTVGEGIDILRTNVPERVRKPIVQGVEQTFETAASGGPIPRAIGEGIQRIPVVGEYAGIPQRVTGRVAHEVAEALVPREVWDTALTLIPAAKARTVTELISALTVGDVDAVRAVRQAGARLGKSGIVENGLRMLRDERGEMVPGDFVPDVVIKALSVRRKGPRASVKMTAEQAATARKEVQERFAQEWEVLPPENKKLITTLADTTIPDAERKARLAASRGKKAGDIRGIFEGEGTAAEKLDLAWKARRGADLPAQDPLRHFFDDADLESYKQQIIDAAQKGTISTHEATNLDSALRLIMEGARKNGTTNPIMRHEKNLFARVFGPDMADLLPETPEQLSLMQKILAPFHVWRSLRSGFDNSALGRQGRKVMFSDPVEWAKAIGPNLKSLRSQQGYDEIMEIIHRDEFYDLGQSVERPLAIVEQGSGLADEYLSPITKHVPLLRASERAYLGFLNAVRQSVFAKNMRALVKAHGTLNDVPMESIQQVIDNINNATMFGNLAKAGDWTRALGQTFFSARGLVSGPQFFGDFIRIAMNPNADPVVRKIVAKRFAAYVGSSVTTLMAANQMGYWLNEKTDLPVFVGAELNPWSQSFGEMRVGPTKFNPWGSESTLVRAALQFASARQLSEGEEDPHKVSRNEIAARVIRNKLSPGASVFFDLTFNKGRDYQGRPIVDRQWQYAIEQSSPLFWWDVQDSMKEQGWWGLADIGQFFGADVQTYGPNETVEKRAVKEGVQKKLIESGYPDRDETFKSNASFRAAFAEAFNVPPDKVPSDFSEFRDGMIKRAVAAGLSEAEAAYKFDNHPFVNSIEQKLSSARNAFWEAHPDLLQEALDAGLTDYSQKKEEILR